MRRPRTLLAVLISMALSVFIFHARTDVASATHGTIPATAAPAWIINTINDRCHNYGWNIVQIQWISPNGSPASSSTSVAYNSPSVPLQLNRITYRCKASDHSYGSSLVVSTSPSIGALNGLVSDMPYPGSANTYSTAVLKTFNYPGPFTSTTDITLTLKTRGTTTYSDGRHYCAVVDTEPRVSTPSDHDFTPAAHPGFCYISTNDFTIRVNVADPNGFLQGIKVVLPGNTALPNGDGNTSLSGIGSSASNSYRYDDVPPGNRSFSGDDIVQSGGVYYERIGYSACNNRTNCHGSPTDIGSSITVNVPAGGYTDTRVYYRRNNPPNVTFSVDCTNLTFTVNDPEGNAANLVLRVDGVNTAISRTNVASGSTVSINISAWRDLGAHNFGLRVTDRRTGEVYDTSNQTPGRCLRVVCGNFRTSPSPPEAGVPFSATASFNVVDSSGSISALGANANSHSYSIRLAINNGVLASKVIGSGNIGPGQSTKSATENGLTAPAGQYRADYSFANSITGTISCSDNNLIVVNKPYFRVYNSDAAVGFAVCQGWPTSHPDATIAGYNNGSGAGSGTQLGAFALGVIREFTSATGRSSSPTPPSGLSFSNTAGGTYGGLFNAAFCPPDYYGDMPATVSTLGAGNINIGSLGSGNYSVNGDTSISGTVGSGRDVVIYVDGDVHISNNISTGGTWASVDDIPSFYLIVRGNIYINPGVSQIAGVFVAQPDGSGGEVYTCGYGFRTPTTSELVSACDNKLTINGAVIAKRIRLLRTNGSLANSAPAETRTSPTIAESFIFGPENWFNTPALTDNPNPGYYDSITTLPPVL